MHPVLAKTFGGLTKSYYFRQFFFGLIFLTLLIFVMPHGKVPASKEMGMYAFFILNTFLYPYSRFVYESAVGFIMGNNVFFVNAILMLIVKVITMMMCWNLAIFIAPVGLAYLYYRNREVSNLV